MTTKEIEKLKKEFTKLTPDEIDNLADGMDNNSTIPFANTYQVPRIIATYWRPALPAPAAKILDYLVFKTYGYGKDETGDQIAWSQILKGTAIKSDTGKIKIMKDHGAGVVKSQIAPALLLLELLNIIQVTRRKDDTGKNLTSHYRVNVIEDFEKLTEQQKIAAMLVDPFKKVKVARQIIRSSGFET